MFKLSKTFIEQYKDKQPNWGFSGLGYVVYKRSYARPTDNGTEEYWQTCQRVVEGTFELQRRHVELMRTRWNAQKAQKSAQEMFRLMWEFKFLPPGRGLWAMGTPLVMERNNGAALLNCGFCSTQEIDFDFPAPFCFLFEASAHGVGVGFDTTGAGKVTIVEPKIGTDVFVVEDSREGWSDLLKRTLLAYVGKANLPGSIDYSQVRPFGAPIKTFGGTASGPEALKELIEKDIPSILTPGTVTSTQIVDVMNVIGKCVVAGGARRSSEIALGDINDQDFMELKLDKEKLYAYRWNSNNTVIVPEGYNHFERFIDPIMDNGEPGFYFRHNAQRYGRMADPVNNLDQKALGVNPCFAGEMELLTESGYKSFSELENLTVNVISQHGKNVPARVWKSGVKPTVFVNLRGRDPLHCTADHVWMTTDGPCEAQDLSGKRLKSYYTTKPIEYSEALFAGFIQGDGSTGRLKSSSHLGLEIKFNEKDIDVMRLVGADKKVWYSTKALNIAKLFNLSSNVLPERTFPEYEFTEQELSDFLTGVFSANGSVIRLGRVALKGTCKAFIDEVKVKLAQLGIDSYITTNKPTKVKFSNGEYLCKQSYDLNIGRYEELLKFAEKVNFIQEYKRENLQQIIEGKAPLVTKVVPGETEDVFDFAMEEDHWGVVNGYIAHNCGEQTLESYELCNIAETFPANCESLEEYLHAIKYAYLYTKTVTLVQTPWPRTNEIMLRNRRIGLSMSGIVQNINKLGFAEHIRWCDEAYNYVQHLDKIYSEWLCIRPSIKTTTVKPSGSVSLLTGSTPGIHYPHSQYYLRRVRFTKSSPMLNLLEEANYPIEQDLYDKNSMVVSFPIQEQHYVRGKKDINIWEQLENAAQMQAHWSDNSVSITVEIKEEERGELAQALSRYQSRLKTVSFLPPSHSYEQAPYEEISAETYQELSKKIKPLNLNQTDHEVTDKFCDSDVCQI